MKSISLSGEDHLHTSLRTSEYIDVDNALDSEIRQDMLICGTARIVVNCLLKTRNSSILRVALRCNRPQIHMSGLQTVSGD